MSISTMGTGVTDTTSILNDSEISKLVQSENFLNIWIEKMREPLDDISLFLKYLTMKIHDFEKTLIETKKTYNNVDKLTNRSNSSFFLYNLRELNNQDNKTIQTETIFLNEIKSIKDNLTTMHASYTSRQMSLIDEARRSEADCTEGRKMAEKYKAMYSKQCQELVKLKTANQLTPVREEQLRSKIAYSYSEYKNYDRQAGHLMDLQANRNRPTISKKFLELFLEISEFLRCQFVLFFKIKEKYFTIIALNLFENSSLRGSSGSNDSSYRGLNSVIDLGDPRQDIYDYLKSRVNS
ncbi:hypothetical protein CANARDRAFT_150984 [[Candida] arabinofermentans NRRL YB-2248]|uniref:F-BAR domain-containing protein n=1 Tax=[Candida] arabinofermentans NRRL YB-2248 TaxID=983967 RepID=A0A1E4T0U8_9ASCO|nr:hypothetical protein CANARDRAFT_150984 [[Candida] arabinofermentans NRRL YB-2248]